MVWVAPQLCQRFVEVNLQYDSVFNPALSKYNGFSGKVEITEDMGPT